MAKRLASLAGKSASTVARALLDAGDDAEAVAACYGPEPEFQPRRGSCAVPAGATQLPCRADVLDDEVEAERLCEGSVEKAKTELNPVGRRINRGKGAVPHLCIEAQARALELEAAEA
jgi:hypothetical protein